MHSMYVLVGFLLVLDIFLYKPAPSLTPNLKLWHDKGDFYTYKHFHIFYIDEQTSVNNTQILVCLHGYPTSSYDWVKIHDDLVKMFSRVIYIDFLGFGFSDKPRHYKYTIAEQADIIEAFLESNGIDSYHILSHDYGDTVALELLSRFNSNKGKKIVSLAMMNGGIFPETNNPRPIQKLLLVPVLGSIISKMAFYHLFKFSFSEIFGTKKPSTDELWDFWVVFEHKHGSSVSSELMQFIPERTQYKKRWVGALVKTTVPVTFIYGPADIINPTQFITHYKKLLPKQDLSVLDDGVGHYPQWEAPVEVVKAYKKFLKKVIS
ncbi:mesoderm-specific transcript homolog protein [Octopus sinensis]|uniref:Mesoderm-specific transcript homolog protein n=1 Tax=Octopus sinensis TaxID=2607531 RepID=A0A6P7TJU8_9MOLL|nr:mesoderm-specific transcript homolog protein [Octopus sinensis]XP_036369845.1 mesoderm-specific transcript homolog protein [Octopus sinensis]XP_036369846.1 mesoderm-specific transcript homolog protein [Octopus sinensis]